MFFGNVDVGQGKSQQNVNIHGVRNFVLKIVIYRFSILHFRCEFLASQTGGSALNSSKILSLLGEKENVFCGAIGSDVIGSDIRQQLERVGLKAW